MKWACGACGWRAWQSSDEGLNPVVEHIPTQNSPHTPNWTQVPAQPWIWHPTTHIRSERIWAGLWEHLSWTLGGALQSLSQRQAASSFPRLAHSRSASHPPRCCRGGSGHRVSSSQHQLSEVGFRSRLVLTWVSVSLLFLRWVFFF